jgi:hypothetical protein
MNWVESICKHFYPPATREHVMGDLRERHSTRAGFLWGAVTTLPYVVVGQTRRNVNPTLVLVQAVALLGSFVLSVPPVLRDRAPAFWADSHGLERVLVAVLAALVPLILGDAYVEIRRRARFHDFRQWALAYAAAMVASFVFQPLALPKPVLLFAAGIGLGFLPIVRLLSSMFAGRARLAAAQPASLETFQEEAQNFRRKVRERNIVEYCAMAIVAAGSVAGIITQPGLALRIAVGLMIPGVLVVATQFRKRASASPMPPNLSAHESVKFYRSELERQYRALRSIFWWYLAPLLPSILAITAVQAKPEGPLMSMIGAGVGIFLFGGFVVWLNRVAAKEIKRKIDILDEWEKHA